MLAEQHNLPEKNGRLRTSNLDIVKNDYYITDGSYLCSYAVRVQRKHGDSGNSFADRLN